LTAH
jgi:hypothetical protein